MGPLTVLVNNASIFEHDTLETATRDSWDRHIGSNLRAPFVLTQAFAAQLPPPPARDGEPVAGALNLLGRDALYGRNWGAVVDAPFLHFELCYYQAIEFAIERGMGLF